VEPIARAQVGTIPTKEVWKGLVEGLPNGQPEQGDEGLDNTHTWGRTYWGGALFCFLADVTIRERTNNRASLETALRGILAFGSGERRASLEEVLHAGDVATGTTVLAELHARQGEKSETTDMATLWKKLGVKDERGEVSFDDAAPLSGLRKAMTQSQ
jgi:predicted metalloprotease with PDZ domain